MRFMSFIGHPFYNKFRIMSSALFPHILFLLGLNFINVLCLSAKTGPSFRFAGQLAGVGETMFYDIVTDGDTVWLAGDGLYQATADSLKRVIDDERVTSVVFDRDSNTLWYAGAGGVYHLSPGNVASQLVKASSNFIWELVAIHDRICYISNEEYGWINPATMEIESIYRGDFSPRPFVTILEAPVPKLLVGTAAGLWELTPSGKRLFLSPEAVDGAIIPWAKGLEDSYLIGTNSTVYSWSGNQQDALRPISSNYGDYFKAGISNSLDFGDMIPITDYPSGVAVWSVADDSITSRVLKDEGIQIGDVFKIEKRDSRSFYMLGESGIASVDLDSQSRFFPEKELLHGDAIRGVAVNGEHGYLFTDEAMIEFSSGGFMRTDLRLTADWFDVDPDGNLVCGTVNGYDRWMDGRWELTEFPVGIFDLRWGREHAYALGGEGVYLVSPDLEMSLIHRERRQLELLGEWQDEFYVMAGDGSLMRLGRDRDWQEQVLPWKIEGEFIRADANNEGVWIATTDNLYRINGDSQVAYPVTTSWKIKDISILPDQVTVLYEQPNQRQWSAGVFSGDRRHMLSIPYKDYIGEPAHLISSPLHVGVIGSGGIGWYDRSELPQLEKPQVDFALLFENKRIEDRTIPAGMHFIDLHVTFSEPSVPCVVQYRINEERWRNVNLQDPTLQFAGHGTFSVELRAVHPNGNVSPSKVVQFGIAPPWYLNPIYQGIMIALALLMAWLIYYIRSKQLKRTNLWLQNEVKKQTRELEAATAARTNFLAGLSHDIRNPLNGVLMIAETLSRKPPVDGNDPRLKDLTEFGIIVDRMLGEILDFSAIDQEKIPTSYIPVSVSDIIESSVKQNQFSIQHEMVSIITSIPDELKDVVIRTDRNWMIKVLSNLIVNALEYSESPRVEVGARCLRLGEKDVNLELYVADWGVGIDDSEKEYVFERFYRGETGIESGKHGTGLGLSICQEIAHAMGGHIRIEDNDPSGCRFVLTGRFDRIEGARELDKEAILGKLSGKRILIVDDLVYNRRSIVEFFETIGCICDQAENGRDALLLLEKNDYYLALLDWDLPGIMGPEIARRHRRKFPRDPVILVAVTAYTDGEKKRESEEAGMNGYISKPLTATRLAYCLGNIENWTPERIPHPDKVDVDEVQEEIYKHIEDCLHYGEHYEWENLRRCAHRLTTLALIKDNRPMQQVCRDLQIAASDANIKESQVRLLELQKWRKS